MESIKWAVNNMPKTDDRYLKIMSVDNVAKARSFHESFPEYSLTPLIKLDNMAKYLGLGSIYIKDESYRFGLNAFKVLGGSYAVGKYIAKEINRDISDVPYDVLVSDKLEKKFGHATFFTATDGNHGRGIAWAANKLNQRAVVLMPKGSTRERLENILALNADAKIMEYNYDDCVRMANELAKKTEHGVMVQDTAWEGYEEIPSWIMQGYGTMSNEAYVQLRQNGCMRPTHIFVQAGVGSLAASVQGYFSNRYPDNPPKVVVVEASAAACLYKSAAAGDGKIRSVRGDLKTIMAGLACGEPNTIAWDILKNHAESFVSIPDWTAALGMRMLGAPLRGDKPVTSGESGAASFGALAAIADYDQYQDLKAYLGLNENSHVLCFSTEGNTDTERYESIVWDGKED